MGEGSEGISWLCNIVQKCEDLFSEIDDAVRQELTSVTNPLQTVVQFCQDLMEEESPLPLENTEKDQASKIDVKDSDSSKIRTDEDHCEKESLNENHLHSTSSVEPIDGIQFDQYVDNRLYERSEVIDNENLLKEKLFQHDMSVAVSLKGKVCNNLEEDKKLQHEMSDLVSPKEEGSYKIEDVSSYISSPTASSNSDYSFESCENLVLDVEDTPTDALTESPDESIAESISLNEDDRLNYRIFEKNLEDYLYCSLVEKDPEYEKAIEDYLESKAVPISRRQQAHISYLRLVQPHYSMMKTITQNLDQIVQEEENLRSSMLTTPEEQDNSRDSDWVIV